MPKDLNHKWLDPQQIKEYMGYSQKLYKSIYKHIFGPNSSRIYLLYEDFGLVTVKTLLDNKVVKFLRSKGYTINIPTTIAGKTWQDIKRDLVRDKYGRPIVKIGGIFAKYHNEQLLERYQNMCRVISNAASGDVQKSRIYSDPAKYLKILLSKHPADIAGMSTNKNWTSCMNIRDGGYHQYVQQDVRYGAMVAYLFKKEDFRPQDAIARILVLPYYSGDPEQGDVQDYLSNPDKYLLYTTSNIYMGGNFPRDMNFVQTVKKYIFNTHNKRLFEKAERHFDWNDRFYDDGYPGSVSSKSNSIIPINKETNIETLKKINFAAIEQNKFYSLLKPINDIDVLDMAMSGLKNSNSNFMGGMKKTLFGHGDEFSEQQLMVIFNYFPINQPIHQLNDNNFLMFTIKKWEDQPLFDIALEMGSDVNMKNKAKNTPLAHAIIKHNEYMVKELIKRGANVNDTVQNDETILQLANRSGNVRIVKAVEVAIKSID